MFGLDLMVVGLVHLASTDVQCRQRISPSVKVTPTQSVIKYDFSKSQDELAQFDIDTISPYDNSVVTHVGGLMAGEIQIEQRIQFVQEIYERVGKGCIHIKDVEVNISMDPTIYIANKHKKGTCKFNEIMEHEKKHVRVDQIVVNRYAKLIGQDVKKSLQTRGVKFGPLDQSELERVQNEIQDSLAKVITRRQDQMSYERKHKQQAVDSKEEYDRISHTCPK